MSNQEQQQQQDLTSDMQGMVARMNRIQAELDSLKKLVPVLARVEKTTTNLPSTLQTSITGSRRKALKRLGLALLGSTAAVSVGVPAAQARLVANPVLGTSSSKAGAIIVPPGAASPTGNPHYDGHYYGLIATADTSALDLSSLPADNIGVYATSLDIGVYGNGNYQGVVGAGLTGVYGLGGFCGLYGYGNSYGVIGIGEVYAAYFGGAVEINGTLSKSSGSFKIDHPLDPANKYLYHSFVESPDMKNIYDGIVILNNQGEATVTLPEWFDALNMDFRYQLTSIGKASPNLHIAGEVQGTSFKVGGGAAGERISWMVTGIRQDEWAKTHRITVEEEKKGDEKGKYLHPELFGQPEELSVSPGNKAGRPH